MNQDLENYIKQARQTDKSDETIKQELRNAGWQESTVSQALGSNTSFGTSVSKTGGLSVKTIGGIVLGLAILGGIFYFYIGRPVQKIIDKENSLIPTNTQQLDNQSSTNGVTSSGFSCEDLLPADDFKRITQKELSKYLPKWDIVRDGLLGCEVTEAYSLPWLSFGVIARWEEGDIRWDSLKEQALKSTSQYSKYEQVSNIGSDAYFFGNSLNVLSSNKKYTFDVTAPTKEQSIEIANIIDVVLNKY